MTEENDMSIRRLRKLLLWPAFTFLLLALRHLRIDIDFDFDVEALLNAFLAIARRYF